MCVEDMLALQESMCPDCVVMILIFRDSIAFTKLRLVKKADQKLKGGELLRIRAQSPTFAIRARPFCHRK